LSIDKPNLIESIIPHSGRYSLKRDARLNIWLAVATATYLAELALRTRNPEWSPLTRGLLALTPLLPGLLYLRSWHQFVRSLDELQQRIQLEAFLFAALGTVILGTVIDTLNANGVVGPLLPQGLGLGGMIGVMFTLWLVGGAVANCRYR
jgi:hypothetical protein